MMHVNRLATILITGLVTGLLASCHRQAYQTTEVTVTDPVASETAAPTPAESAVHSLALNNSQLDFTPINIQPSAMAAPQLAQDLSNIVNIDSFANLTENQRSLLIKNHFVVTPSSKEQLFYIYEENEYKAIPGFITTDSVLQLFHVFYDYALRETEETHLLPALEELTAGMINLSRTDTKASAYFAVAQSLLRGADASGQDLTPDARQIVQAELALIRQANGSVVSPLTGVLTDYGVFTPRGHYTRNEDFTRFFKTMMWYGSMYFPVYDNTNRQADVQGTRLAAQISMALTADENLRGLWENIFSPTAFFVGDSDDLTPFDVYNEIGKINNFNIESDESIKTLAENLAVLHKARIQNKLAGQKDVVQFRFMGQRYTPDADILQSLSGPYKRPVPSGLDVAAVLGSADARNYIDEYFNPTAEWPDFSQKFNETKVRFDALPQEIWQSNMYYGWLWALKPMLDGSQAYDYFMTSPAWRDKNLATALGSWTTLRHDTVLYVKPSAAEMGGWPETRYSGYVEPAIGVYERLRWLTQYSLLNLTSRGWLNENLQTKAEEIIGLLDFLIECSQKELRSEPLSDEDQAHIVRYGGELEYLSATIASDNEAGNWYEIEPEADRDMALAVDVHSTGVGVLTESIGRAAEIYVVTVSDGKLILTRGAVYDTFEAFTSERLTDEEWQDSLDKATAGAPFDRPAWTQSYIDTTGFDIPIPNPPDESYLN